MKDVVITQGKTVEEAINEALKQLNIDREDADVEVLTNPSTKLLRFKRELAKVRVTKKNKQPTVSEFDSLIDEVFKDEHIQASEEVKVEEQVATVVKNRTEEPQSIASRVSILNGELSFDFKDEPYPTVEVGEGISLFLNDVIQHGKVTITPEDEVKLIVQEETISPKFSIELIDNKMAAKLTFTPGEKITRTIEDTAYVTDLYITASEEVTYFNHLEPQEIVQELRKLGVQSGMLFPAIHEVIQAEESCEVIVAKGIAPKEGKDGDVEVYVDMEEFDPESLERIDFREKNQVLTVKEGTVIAKHIPPILGEDGQNLLGEKVPARKVQDVVFRLGKNVQQVEGEIIAEVSGNPAVDKRDKLVKIEVNHELFHPGEVGLESGNIRSEGDVRIGGNVLPTMFVGASGSVHIQGAVTQATVEAMKSAVISGNVLSSSITVGKRDVVLQELVEEAKKMTRSLQQVAQALEQIFISRGTAAETIPNTAVKQLIHLLIEKRMKNFERLNKDFVKRIHSQKGNVADEWQEIADELHMIFIAPLNVEVKGKIQLSVLQDKIQRLIDNYYLHEAPTGSLQLPYAVNSQLYCNGDIMIRSRGVFQTTLMAENNIVVDGVCRGGEVIARNNITLKETGSKSPVTTIIKTGEKGRIKIGTAYVGTEIQIGNRKYEFVRDDYSINARLDEDGMLVLK